MVKKFETPFSLAFADGGVGTIVAFIRYRGLGERNVGGVEFSQEVGEAFFKFAFDGSEVVNGFLVDAECVFVIGGKE